MFSDWGICTPVRSRNLSDSSRLAEREPRPAQVSCAVRLLWVALAFGLLRLVLDWKSFAPLNENAMVEDVCLVVAFATLGLLLWKTGQGCAEARVVLLTLYAFSATSGAMTPGTFASLSGFAITLIELYPCYLLVTSPSRRWFAARKDPMRARPERPAAHA